MCMYNSQPQFTPNTVNLRHRRRVGLDGASPVARGFARPFRGCVQPHFAAEAAGGAGKVEVVNRRVFDEQGVAHRVGAGGERPDDVAPVAAVDVVIDDYQVFGVAELAQVAPAAQHDAPRVPGVFFFDADHGDAVGAAFRRQVEIDDFRKLFLQQGDIDFVQGGGEDGGLVRRFAEVGAVVDRAVAQGGAFDGKHGKFRLAVVVAGVVAVGAFGRHVAGVDVAFEEDFRAGGGVQAAGEAHHFAARAAQESGEAVFAQGVRDGGDGGEQRRRVAADGDGDGKGAVGMRLAMGAVVKCAAAMGEPAHDDAVFADRLLAVDGDVLPGQARALRDDQPPGDERRDVVRPGVLDGQAGEVNVVARQHGMRAGRRVEHARRHVPDVFGETHFAERLGEVVRRRGFFQIRQLAANRAQPRRLHAHAQRHPFARAEQVGKHGITVAAAVGADGVFKEQRRAAVGKDAARDFGDFQMRRDGVMDALQRATAFQQGDEGAQVGTGLHECLKVYGLPSLCGDFYQRDRLHNRVLFTHGIKSAKPAHRRPSCREKSPNWSAPPATCPP